VRAHTAFASTLRSPSKAVSAPFPASHRTPKPRGNSDGPAIGSGAGDCAPAPSHTTVRAVFRIRRLDYFASGLLKSQNQAPRHSERLQRLLRPSARWSGQSRDRSCRALLLRLFVSPSFQASSSCAIVLRPFARNAFSFVRSSNATMASADFPQSLNSGISPGQRLFFPFAPLGSTACRQ